MVSGGVQVSSQPARADSFRPLTASYALPSLPPRKSFVHYQAIALEFYCHGIGQLVIALLRLLLSTCKVSPGGRHLHHVVGGLQL